MNSATFFRKFTLSLVFILLPYCLIAGVFETDKKKDKRIIETVARQYLSVKTKAELTVLLDKTFLELSGQKSESAKIITNVFMANKNASEQDQLNPTSTALFKEALLIARKIARNDLELWVSTQYGFYLYTYRKYEDSFPLFMYCISTLDENVVEQVIQPYDTYKKNAYFLTTAGEYEKAIEYLQQARKYVAPNSSELATIIDGLGLTCIHLNDLTKAEHYFNEALVIAKESKDDLRYAKALGNLAEVKIKQGHCDAAIEFLNQDISISEELHATQNTIYALVLLARAYIGKGNVVIANDKLQLAHQYAQSKEYFKSADYDINLLILDIAKQTGNEKEELAARRRLEKLKSILDGLDGRDVVTKMKWVAEKNKLTLKVQAEKARSQRESYAKIAALIGCAILLTMIGFLVTNYRNKIKVEKTEYEEKIIEKHNQIEKLEIEIDKAKQLSPEHLETYTAEMRTLLNAHLMSAESWLNFKRYFTQIYSDYYQSLLQNFPELTDAQLRIIFLTKLEMDNGEIARILGLTIDAVKKSKQRLRKRYEQNYNLLFDGK